MRESDEIDREAWAKLLAELLTSAGLTPEQAAQPSGPVDANWRTIRKWLTKDQGITARRVRDVSRALGYPPGHALVRVGFLTAAEAGLSTATAKPAPPLDPAIRKSAQALANERIPERAKTLLRRGLNAAYDLWLDTYNVRPPREPAAKDRASGATVREP